ncbi:MAG: histidinol-phosphate transaminase [Pseudomonadota bacterium]
MGSVHWLQQAKAGVQKISPYQIGTPIETVKRELGLTSVIKLASNENALGCSPAVLQAFTTSLKNTQELHRYPDGAGYSLRNALAKFWNKSSDEIILGNGSNDVIDLIARCFAGPNDEVIISEYAFPIYALVAKSVGATIIKTPAQEYGHDVVAMLQAITEKTKVIYIANPNNPTGTWLPKNILREFLSQVPKHIVVVVDEAYSEYMLHPNFPHTISWIQEFPNLIVTRTFSKAYGMASFRFGYSVSHSDIASILNRVRQPFNINGLALSLAEVALSDQGFVQQSCEYNKTGLQQLRDGLNQLKIKFIDTEANFLCMLMNKSSEVIYQELLRYGIIVRPLHMPGLEHAIRITVGKSDENQQCLEALSKII